MASIKKESNTKTMDKFREELANRQTARNSILSSAALREKRPIPGARMMRAGYVRENGLDKNDANLLRRNPQEFDRKVQGTITSNLYRNRKYGIRDGAIERAVERTKKRQEFQQNQEERRRKFNRYMNGISRQKK